MLILLSGSEAIAKPLIARNIIKKLNEPFTVGELSVTYDAEGTAIFTKDGSVIDLVDVITDQDNDGAPVEGYQDIMTSINDNYKTLNDTADENNYIDFFIDFGYDFGVLAEKEYPDNNAPGVTATLADVVAAYNNTTLNNFIICGIFSNAFINDLKTEVGAENVTVINVTRNPSVAYFMHSPSSDFANNDDHEKLIGSMLNAIKLKQEGYTTIKFEDIISSQSITINGTEIDLPASFASANGILNTWENDNLPTKTADEVSNFNASISPLDATLVGAPDNSSTYYNIKLDIFTELSYTALTHAEIIAS